MTAPHDVMLSVAAFMDGIENRPHNYDIGKALERAILAERQRCADVARTCDFEVRTAPFVSLGVADARKGIAAAILNP